jgi:MFS family permease
MKAAWFRSRVAPFRNTDFRRLFIGRIISLLGDSFYFVAALWLVYDLTGSTVYTGIAGFLIRVPQTLKFLAGPVVDRSSLRRVLVFSELLQGIVVLVIPVAALFDYLNVWIVLSVMPLLTFVGLCSGPAQNAALPRVIDDELFTRANSVISIASQGGTAIARIVAGVFITTIGAVTIYTIDAVTFATGAILYGAVRIPTLDGNEESKTETLKGYIRDINDGVRLITGSVIQYLVMTAAIVGLFTGATMAVLPAFAAALGGPALFGIFTATMTAGSLVGSIVAPRFEHTAFGRVAGIGPGFAGLCWVGAVTTQWLPLTVVLFGLAWVPIGIYNVLISTTIQIGVPNDLLGRVSATAGSLAAVTGPVGLLLGGIAGDFLGSRTVIAGTAIGFVSAAGYWYVVPVLRTFPPVTEISAGEFTIEQRN